MKKIIYTALFMLLSLSLQAKDATFFVTNNTNVPLYVQASKSPTDDPLIFNGYIQPLEKRKIIFQVDDVFFPQRT